MHFLRNKYGISYSVKRIFQSQNFCSGNVHDRNVIYNAFEYVCLTLKHNLCEMMD